MIHKETFDAFIEGIKTEKKWNWYLNTYINPNGSDLFIYPDIPSDVKHSIRTSWGIGLDEEILYVRDSSFWNERNQGLVITDCGIIFIPDNDDMDDRIHISWENVNYVEYKDELLYFFGYGDRENNCPIHISHFLKESSDTSKQGAGSIFHRIFTRMAQTQTPKDEDDIYEKTVEQYNQLMNDGKEEEALQLALSYRKNEQNVAFTPEIAWLYHKKGQDEKAFAVIDEDFNALAEDNLTWKGKLYYTKYSIYDDNGDYMNARKDCLYVKRNIPSDVNWDYEDVNILDDAIKDFSRFENEYTQHFLEQPYNERKLIVPVQSYTDLSQKKLAVVDINNLPDINFPMGHPVANQLYVGHPYIPSKYIPFENYELELIEDKIREFSQIMQYLGATEINIESVNSSSNNKDSKIDQKLSGGVDYKLVSGSGNAERHITNKLLEDISQHINLHQKFSPKKYPALPENLVWYHNEPSWQRLYSQRMQGALLEHEERIETKKSQVVENSELKQISAEVKWLFVQANGNWEQSMEEKFEAHENAILSIHVKFAPLEDLQVGTLTFQQNTNPILSALSQSLTEEEVEYLNELKACLEEDGKISSKERRLLNRLRERLGITEERAEELEASLLMPELTEEEQEYLDEYKACIEEGELSPKEIRLLNRLRMSLGISEERAKELETYK
ncbi:hypothetical protein [uncultured Bacteroides sp.]|uniref:hypothetical protein n=1 Tax=uncultured Bacteroides sp. TaxID=162156 RepID=UPI0025D814F4|nr:hypothetical protein [uncultured Bacteroides sp.]